MILNTSCIKISLLSFLCFGASLQASLRPAARLANPTRLTSVARLVSAQPRVWLHASTVVRECGNP